MKTPLFPALLLMLCGCSAVGPEITTPEPPAADRLFSTEEGHEVESLAKWWHRFNDPVLADLVDEGLKNSPTVASALAKLRASRASREGAEAEFYPHFSADGSYTWQRGWGKQSTGGKRCHLRCRPPLRSANRHRRSQSRPARAECGIGKKTPQKRRCHPLRCRHSRSASRPHTRPVAPISQQPYRCLVET